VWRRATSRTRRRCSHQPGGVGERQVHRPGDSIGEGWLASGPQRGYVSLYFNYLSQPANGGLDDLRNESKFGQGSNALVQYQLPNALAEINDDTDTRVVTIEIGINDGWGCPGTYDSPTCPLAGNLTKALDDSNAALANDPGDEVVQVMEYYNPASGTGTANEQTTADRWLGTDRVINCSGRGYELGMNDLIACIGVRKGAVPVDVYPAFATHGQEYMGDSVHPNDAGHAAIAQLFEDPSLSGNPPPAAFLPPTLTSAPPTAHNANSATVDGLVNANGDATTWFVEYGTTTSYGSQTAAGSAGDASVEHAVSTSLSGLDPGTTYHYRLVAANQQGTTYGQDQSVTTVPSAPTLTGTQPTSPSNDPSPRLLGSAGADTTVRVYTTSDCTGEVAASGSAGEFSAGLQVSGSSDSSTTFHATATDAGGQTSVCSSTSVIYTEDSTAPATTDDVPDGWQQSPVLVTLSATDAGGPGVDKTYYTTGANPPDPTTSSAVYDPASRPTLGDGESIKYFSTDQAGNSETVVSSPAARVDDQPPATVDDVPVASRQSSVAVTLTANDVGGAGLDRTYYTTGIDPPPPTSESAVYDPASKPTLADGERIAYLSTDMAGNAEPIKSSAAFRVDTTPPDTTITAGPSGATWNSTPMFAFTSTDHGSRFLCRVDGGAWTACATPLTTAVLADGAHSLAVRAVDPAGNVDSSPAGRSFTVDTVAPQTAIATGPVSLTGDSTPAFGLSSSEAGSSFRCRVDSGVFRSCSSPFTTSLLIDGTHNVAVRALDRAGNSDPSPASRSFTVDTVPPQTTILSGPSGRTSDLTPTFGFSSSESGSTFKCQVDARPYASCWSPFTTASLPDGTHSFRVRAVDRAGNGDPSPAGRAFTVAARGP
jgi:lysophospholipase L1-like esterase